MKKDAIDIVIGFDTTGSMAPCISQVRDNVEDLVKRLFTKFDNLRIGIINMGDYCDGDRAITKLDLTDNQSEICKFVRTTPNTDGGDRDECYELMLNTARGYNWKSATNKVLLVIGDAEPHEVGYRYRDITNKLDWQNEAKLLAEAGVNIYSVQCLSYRTSDSFYEKLAKLGNGLRLQLTQFRHIEDLLEGVVWQRAGVFYEYELLTNTKTKLKDRWFSDIIDTLAGRSKRSYKPTKSGLEEVNPSRFQVLDVRRDIPIKKFVTDNNLLFHTGRGFYQFNKTETIQDYKEVILQDKNTGLFYTGDTARKLAGIPIGEKTRLKPEKLVDYDIFVQSTSNNRKLMKGTKFLYEVDSSR